MLDTYGVRNLAVDKKGSGSEVWLHLSPDLVDANAFLSGVRSFLRLVRSVSSDISSSNEDGEKVCISVKVEKGSNRIGACLSGGERFPIYRDEIRTSLISGLDSIGRDANRPAHYSDEALKNVISLGRVLTTVGGYIRWDESRVDVSLHSVANAEKLLSVPFRDIGSVEGELRLISDVKGPQIGVIEVLSGRFVKCSFGSEDDIDELARQFHHRVALKGYLTYNREGHIKKVEVTDYRFIGMARIPTANEVRGILRDH